MSFISTINTGIADVEAAGAKVKAIVEDAVALAQKYGPAVEGFADDIAKLLMKVCPEVVALAPVFGAAAPEVSAVATGVDTIATAANTAITAHQGNSGGTGTSAAAGLASVAQSVAASGLVSATTAAQINTLTSGLEPVVQQALTALQTNGANG